MVDDLTMSECFKRMIKVKFEYLELTLEEFAQFFMIISDRDMENISFKKPVWHDTPIKIVEG